LYAATGAFIIAYGGLALLADRGWWWKATAYLMCSSAVDIWLNPWAGIPMGSAFRIVQSPWCQINRRRFGQVASGGEAAQSKTRQFQI
jgi:hypothetical protein